MARATITIRCPEFYDLYMTCHVHGWINLAPFAWADEKHVLRFAALVDHQPVGYRAAYLKALAEVFAHASPFEAVEKNRCDYKAADKLFRQLKGFADYAAAHLLLLAGYYNEIPVDTVVVAYLKKNHHVRKPKSFIDRHYRKWGKFKWWGYKLEKMLNHQNWLGD
jgi:thermostable 8-oxoguanine DNA glycosylase